MTATTWASALSTVTATGPMPIAIVTALCYGQSGTGDQSETRRRGNNESSHDHGSLIAK
jgi:hypothetical protein